MPKPDGRFTSENRPTPPPRRGRNRKRGIPAPATFDIDTLPGSAWLTNDEVAAVLRKAVGTPAVWRRDPNHSLRWKYLGGRALYRVDDLRAFIAAQPGRD